MKNKLFLLSAIAGMFMMTSCSSGPSAETKTKVAALDSAWSLMNTAAKAVSDSLNMCATMCENGCKAGDAMECCEHVKGAKDSLMTPCKNDMAMFQDMKKSWESQKPMWDSLQAKLDGIKADVASGKGKDADINAGVAELQTALDNGNKALADFATKLSEAKMGCMKNMDACKTAWGNVKCMDKKCPMGMGKKKA